MAINDDLNTRNRTTGARTDGMGMLPIILAIVAIAALAWWFLGDRMMNTGSASRTSAPITGSPTTGTSTPTTTPKQP